MRGLQGDMEEFRQATAHHEQRPRPPNKAKSSFYEGPPQRPGSVRGRFLKVRGSVDGVKAVIWFCSNTRGA